MPEDYDTHRDKDGIVKRVREVLAHAAAEYPSGYIFNGYAAMPFAVRTALQFRPIRNAQNMLTYGQTIYDSTSHVVGYCVEPVAIVDEIQRQTRIKLIRVRNARLRLYPHLYPRSKERGFSAAYHTHKQKVEVFWRLTALAINYGGSTDIHWLVKKLVDDSFPTKCCVCNRRLGRESVASLLPEDVTDYELLLEAKKNNQLKLRCFCNWKCQPSDKSAQWHLKQLEQTHKKLRKFRENAQRESAIWTNAMLRRCLEWTDADMCAFPLCAHPNAKDRWNLCRYHKAKLNAALRNRRIAADNILRENI
jgi:hypothetical protein